jgi:hypothetical protein
MTMTGSTAFVVEIQSLQKLLADKDAEIERLKSWNQTLKQIVADAADALERAPVLPPKMIKALIAELRKAAE